MTCLLSAILVRCFVSCNESAELTARYSALLLLNAITLVACIVYHRVNISCCVLVLNLSQLSTVHRILLSGLAAIILFNHAWQDSNLRLLVLTTMLSTSSIKNGKGRHFTHTPTYTNLTVFPNPCADLYARMRMKYVRNI